MAYEASKKIQVVFSSMRNSRYFLGTMHIHHTYGNETRTFANGELFHTSQDFAGNLTIAIAHFPGGIAPNPGGVYYEMLKSEPEPIANVLQALWFAWGSLAFTPESWNEGTLISLYKKGDPLLQAKYMPICLLSAVRKVIARTIASAVQTAFIPINMQLGFQRKIGTATASVQTIATIKGGNILAALLDLKAADDSIPRDMLIRMCLQKLPPNMVAMITHILQPLPVKTSGAPLQTIGTITRGVTQGGPCSPVLFNISIDELVRRPQNSFVVYLLEKVRQRYITAK